ncbi:MAG: hypothetical protein K9J27_13070 [Bacteroidales bacterium]|nr:hypothetical protein [Bacteroidales bacterium]MCF8302553.1 hypothetical protein [Bacteroidales bacterium]
MKKAVILKIVFLLTLLSFSLLLFAQLSGKEKHEIRSQAADVPRRAESTVERLASYLTKGFEKDVAKTYAIYYWVANNIRYDFDEAESITLSSLRENVIQEALHQQVGVCQHYAELFNALARSAGLKSTVVPGYTKQHGSIDDIPHSWNAAKINGKWYMFDPTWGAGHMTEKRYKKHFTEEYFMVQPRDMLKSHMPFDPLFQFVNHPIDHRDFKTGRHQPDKDWYIDYEKEIERYFSLPEKKQLVEAMERVKRVGIANKMVRGYYSNLNQRHRVYQANEQVDMHNKAIRMMNEVVKDYNEYINRMNARGGRFPDKTENIEALLQTVESKALEVEALFDSLNPTMKLTDTLDKNRKILENLLKQVRREQDRLEKFKQEN